MNVKLKMRFEKDDMIKFGIYALILFILVCFIVSVLVTLSNAGSLSGYNFFIALNKDYFVTTFVIFILLLFGLVASTKTKFFEFEKGFGFTTEKKLDGYSNWCDVKKMKKELKPVIAINPKADAGGIPLINDGKTLWVDDGEYHNLIIG